MDIDKAAKKDTTRSGLLKLTSFPGKTHGEVRIEFHTRRHSVPLHLWNNPRLAIGISLWEYQSSRLTTGL